MTTPKYLDRNDVHYDLFEGLPEEKKKELQRVIANAILAKKDEIIKSFVEESRDLTRRHRSW
mgnify:CR=1 FL=1|tara:strand:- start:205 stop:390 length:186 start_codon:yes stop_codon:yes gene_type:complete